MINPGSENKSPLYIGIDIGTSGCRAMAIDGRGKIKGSTSTPLPPPEQPQPGHVEQDPALWWQGVKQVISDLLAQVPAQDVSALVVDGTSGTVLLSDSQGNPLGFGSGSGLMYNDMRAVEEANLVKAKAPQNSGAQGPSAGLAKLLWLQKQPYAKDARYALHQTDWIIGKLCGKFGISDTNNCLKTGYDPVQNIWPGWLDTLNINRTWLPEVHPPGTLVGALTPELALAWGLNPDTHILAGTTDSTAAVLATGVNQPGDAVTSLGSTLVVKIISEQPVFAADFGVYSQPLGDYWLVGGGSNSGGAVLQHYFNDEQMQQMTKALHPDEPTGLDYYPLLQPGERFPINDPTFAGRLSPRADDPIIFFQGLLEGIAQIEHTGYQRLAELGAPYPTSVRTVGGGAINQAWTKIRGNLLQLPMIQPEHTEAAYGTALLALQGMKNK